MPKPTVSIENVTPQMASQWIERIHPDNRKTRSRRINLYAADMMNDRWHLSNDAIVFSEDGHVINAANRLHAVVVSGKTVPFIVLKHAPEESKIIMDSGMKRSTDDNFKMSGLDYVRNCGATVRKLMYGYTQAAVLAITDQEVAEFMANNGDAVEFAHEHLHGKVSKAIVRAVVARAYMKRASREKLTRFCEVLDSGMSVCKEEGVIIRLRNLLIDMDPDTRATTKKPRAIYGKTERALKAYLVGEDLARLEPQSMELFPIRSIDKFDEEE